LNKKLKKKTKNRQSEQKRDRLKQLEQEVADLKRKEKDTQKMIKIKEENEKQCEKLRQEIQHIKQERVKLIKQMKQETDSFRKYKQEKEKEVNHLKALDRKRMVEITKLQEGNNRQEAILRRKNEEISRIQKQLRETSEKQKIVAEKRQQTFDRKENSSLGDKLRSWITQELELSVGLAEARINLNNLLAERKETAAELAKLQEELNKFDELMPPPQQPSKRKFDTDTTYIAGSSVGNSSSNCVDDEENQLNKLQLEQRIERIKEDIEMKSVQINEIQQMVIEGDQDDRAKHLFNNIHGLLEAKVLIKHLYSSGVQYLLDCKLKQTQFETNTTGIF
jgi:kinesin family member 4